MSRHIPRAGTLQPLAPVLVHTLRQAGLGRVVLLGQIMQHWEEIVGPQIAAIAQPEGLRTQMLFVTVTDAIWLQQLTFYHTQLLRNIRRVLGNVPITRLHFTLAVSSRAPVSRSKEVPVSLLLTAEEESQVLEDTADIADADLREAVRQAWRRGWQSRRLTA